MSAAFWCQATSMPAAAGLASSSIRPVMLSITGYPPSLAAKPRERVMINTLALGPLAKAVSARRETQRHLDCLSRQIAARWTAGDNSEGAEPGASPKRSTALPSGTCRAACLRKVGRTRRTHLRAGDTRASHRRTRALRSPARAIVTKTVVRTQCGGRRVSTYPAAMMSASVVNLAMSTLYGLLVMSAPCRTALLFAAV